MHHERRTVLAREESRYKILFFSLRLMSKYYVPSACVTEMGHLDAALLTKMAEDSPVRLRTRRRHFILVCFRASALASRLLLRLEAP